MQQSLTVSTSIQAIVLNRLHSSPKYNRGITPLDPNGTAFVLKPKICSLKSYPVSHSDQQNHENPQFCNTSKNYRGATLWPSSIPLHLPDSLFFLLQGHNPLLALFSHFPPSLSRLGMGSFSGCRQSQHGLMWRTTLCSLVESLSQHSLKGKGITTGTSG